MPLETQQPAIPQSDATAPIAWLPLLAVVSISVFLSIIATCFVGSCFFVVVGAVFGVALAVYFAEYDGTRVFPRILALAPLSALAFSVAYIGAIWLTGTERAPKLLFGWTKIIAIDEVAYAGFIGSFLLIVFVLLTTRSRHLSFLQLLRWVLSGALAGLVAGLTGWVVGGLFAQLFNLHNYFVPIQLGFVYAVWQPAMALNIAYAAKRPQK
jgi:hypothetical protein